MLFRWRRNKQKSRKLGVIDYAVLGAMLIFAIYSGINRLKYGSPNQESVQTANWESFWAIFRYFDIGIFETIAIILLAGYLGYRKYKRKQSEVDHYERND